MRTVSKYVLVDCNGYWVDESNDRSRIEEVVPCNPGAHVEIWTWAIDNVGTCGAPEKMRLPPRE